MQFASSQRHHKKIEPYLEHRTSQFGVFVIDFHTQPSIGSAAMGKQMCVHDKKHAFEIRFQENKIE